MINYLEALKLIENISNSNINIRNVPLLEALGYILANDVYAKISNPNFDNSAMDGFALHFNDIIFSNNEEYSAGIPITDTIIAGSSIKYLPEKSAMAIMTGAIIPSGCDIVVKKEDVQVSDNKIFISAAKKDIIARYDNIRNKGEDFKQGDIIAHKGLLITPEFISLFAAAGVSSIDIFTKNKVAVISTGEELLNVNNSQESVSSIEGKIYDSNSPYLLSILKKLNITSNYLGNIVDNTEYFIEKITESMSSVEPPNIIISTGAVSCGVTDFIPDTIKKLGFEIIFHKVAIRPGKPILLARKMNIANEQVTYFFGLPGNPRSVMVGFHFFVYILIKQLYNKNFIKNFSNILVNEDNINSANNLENYKDNAKYLGLLSQNNLKIEQAILTSNFNKKNQLTFFIGAYVFNENSIMKVKIFSQQQESFRLFSISICNCWIILSEEKKLYKAGDMVNIVRLL